MKYLIFTQNKNLKDEVDELLKGEVEEKDFPKISEVAKKYNHELVIGLEDVRVYFDKNGEFKIL